MSESFAASGMEKFRRSIRRDPMVWATALILAILELALSNRYDKFCNELYFIDCGRHPAFGYPDAPPLVSLIAAASQIFGDRTWMLRIPTIASGIALIFLVAAFARELGGNRTAVWMAALAAGIAPAMLGNAAILSTQSFEPLTWTACAYLLFRGAYREDRRAALWAGIIGGLAMEAKYGIGGWALGLGAGILFTPARRVLRYPHLWYGALIGIAIAAPSLIWQAMHGFPLARSAGYSAKYMNLTGTPVQFELKQIRAMNVALAPMWIAGVIAPFVSAKLRDARFLAITFIVTVAIFFGSHGKDYYDHAAYPTMFAVGAVVCATWNRWIRGAMVAGAIAISLALAPTILPVLDPPTLARYLELPGIRPPQFERQGIGAPLTIFFSNELGWRELEQRVAAVYWSLSDEERSHASIITSNYAEAAAIDVYGRDDGLPAAVCFQFAYYDWGTHGYDGSVNIIVNGNRRMLRAECTRTEIVGHFGVPYAMGFENGDLFICRGLRESLEAIRQRNPLHF